MPKNHDMRGWPSGNRKERSAPFSRISLWSIVVLASLEKNVVGLARIMKCTAFSGNHAWIKSKRENISRSRQTSCKWVFTVYVYNVQFWKFLLKSDILFKINIWINKIESKRSWEIVGKKLFPLFSFSFVSSHRKLITQRACNRVVKAVNVTGDTC